MNEKKATHPELSCPPSGPVWWIATLRSGFKSPRTKKLTRRIRRRSWFDVRVEAMRFFGCDPGEVEIVQEK